VTSEPDALLLDEMFSPVIADKLAARGVDCRAVAADPTLRAHDDLEIFQAAVREGRVIVTSNVADFESLRRAHEAAGNRLPGLIYTSDQAFPRTKTFTEQLATALHTAVTARAVHAHGGVLWLRPAARTGQAGPP
jgi:hypothetical protein